ALRPPRVAVARLPEAGGDVVRGWWQGATAEARVELPGEPLPVSPVIEETLFRVAQEALTNVAKHARAGRVGLTLSYLHDTVLLDVRDDGVGLPAGADDGPGFGLRNMRRRVRGVGGAMEIETAPGEGTAISVRVPLITAVAA